MEDEGFQVQFLDSMQAATEIHLRVGGELAGEALVLPLHEVFFLAAMTWHPLGGVKDAAANEQRRRVCEALLQEAVDLADRSNWALISLVAGPVTEGLLAQGFEQNGSMWLRRRARGLCGSAAARG